MLNLETKKRIKKLILTLSITFIILISYYIFVCISGLRIPCIFNLITGLNCPGCGITRMLVAFLQFKFKEGITYNYFLGFTLPLVGFLIFMMCYYYVCNKKYDKWFNIICYLYLILLIIWGVVRNLINI